jgi:hypothetical protein
LFAPVKAERRSLQRASQPPSTGRTVPWLYLEAQQRGDVDDLAAATLKHVLRRGLAEEEHRLEVGVDHRIPIGLAEGDRIFAADDPGVVDQDIELAGRRYRIGNQPFDGIDRCQVGLQVERATAEAFDLRDGLDARGTADCDHVGTAPARANTMAWPMPVFAPVTIATRPERSKLIIVRGLLKLANVEDVHVGVVEVLAGHRPDKGV